MSLEIIAIHQNRRIKNYGIILGPKCPYCEEGYIKANGFCFNCQKYDVDNLRRNRKICTNCRDFYLDLSDLCEMCDYCYGCYRILNKNEHKYCRDCIFLLDLC